MTFEYLSKLDVKDKTSWFELPQIGPGARICGRFAGEANALYFNARVKRASAAPLTKDVRDSVLRDREDDIEIYPTTVLVHWENLPDTEGNPVSFNAEHARDLCRQLPHWLFDRMRNHFRNPANFMDLTEMPKLKELAKN